MYKIGLTGGIGSGKSTVADIFAGLGVPVIDADQAAREVVSIGQPVLMEIQKVFGTKVLNADGALDRLALSDIIFKDQQQKLRLEAMLHPLIYARMQMHVDQLAENIRYCVVAIPLLFETQMTSFVNRILVVDCPEELQIQRVKARDNHSDAKIAAIMQAQVTRQIRCANADDIVDNSVPKSQLAERVKKLHNLYLSISQNGA